MTTHNYDKEEGEFSDIVKKFNKYYELIEDFCKPFMNDEDKTDREKGIEKVIECFKWLEDFYKNPKKLVDDFFNGPFTPTYDLSLGGIYEKDKKEWEARYEENAPPSFFRKELEKCGFNAVKLWMLSEKAKRYNDVLKFICDEFYILDHSSSCRLKDGENNEQEILSLGGNHDYKKGIYLSKLENLKKSQEKLIKKLVLLEQKSWENAIFFWFQNPKFSRELFKEIEGSTNLVAEIGEEVFMYSPSSFIIKKAKKGSSSLRSEKEIIDYLHKDVKTKMEYFISLHMEYIKDYYLFPSDYIGFINLPKIAFFCESQNFEVLAMHKDKWSVEMTKSKLNTKSKEKCLGTIAYFLANIHKKIPLNISKKGIVDISDYIHKWLDNPFLELKGHTKLKISENLTPVLECLVNSPRAIYKDAHPDNFLITDYCGDGTVDCITALDWEDKGFHPIYFDLVNFCEYSEFITSKEKAKWLKDYVQAYNENASEREAKLEYGSNFYLYYLNAVIYRSICFSSAWSKPHREAYKKNRKNMLNKAIGAISIIKNDHSSYYYKYKDNYDSLEKVIKEAITELH